MPKAKLGKNILFNLVLFGFIGQLAWAVENVYFNTFLFNYIGGTTTDISRMVALSAVTAVLSTFIMGTLSDKLNKRKIFISGGYIIWGLTVAVFAFINRENIGNLFGLSQESAVVAATVSVVIIMDCVMTFIGSTGNDAAFNAWVTDVTVPENRGTAEGILATLPILAMVLVTVAFGIGVSEFGYPACFIALGALVTLCGIISIFSLKDSRSGEKSKSNYFSSLVYGFRPSVVKSNASLYLALGAVCLFSTAVQVFMPYIIIYLQRYLGFDLENLNLTPGFLIAAVAVIGGAVAGAVGLGKMVDKFGKNVFIYPSIIIFVAGLGLVFFARKLWLFALLAVIMIAGYGLLMIILNATVRDRTPDDKVGLFQGIRMIFTVLIPMVAGPAMGDWVINKFASAHSGGTYLNDYNELVNVPVPEIFLASAVVAVLIFIPIILMKRREKSAS